VEELDRNERRHSILGHRLWLMPLPSDAIGMWSSF
jgi:hypothetical protein